MTDNTLQLDDERLRRPPSIRSLTLGDTKLSYVPDGKAIFDARLLLPNTTDADWEQNSRYLDEDGNLVGGVGALLIERDGRALLIDGGLGRSRSDRRSTRSAPSAAARCSTASPRSATAPRTSKRSH